MVETLFVSDYLDRDRFTSAVISTMQNLSERSFSQRVVNFISVCQVIVRYDLIISSVIIVTVVIRGIFPDGQFLFVLVANVVDHWVIKNFLTLVISEMLSAVAFQYTYENMSF